MSELLATVRAAVRALADADPQLRRFGAAQHRYELLPPLASVAAIEAELDAPLPEDLAAFACAVAAGGAGPYYGWLPVDRAARFAVAGAGPWSRALPIAHLGCGYAALAILDGSHRGEIWLDARALGMVQPIAPSFTAFYLDWIDRLAHGRWPEGYVPPGACALSAAIGGYLGVCEQRLGIPAGTIAGDALRDALGSLGAGAIEVAADSGPLALFDQGDRVDPCIVCAQLLDDLTRDGLRRDVVSPGATPLPLR